ncbi:hypothetical protein ACQFX6_29210 [Streptomyces sp. DSM 41987]|uniref:hypothetical protein n=1 Tax=Streptomyces TaxID=1883 RepID=UPI0036132D5F
MAAWALAGIHGALAGFLAAYLVLLAPVSCHAGTGPGPDLLRLFVHTPAILIAAVATALGTFALAVRITLSAPLAVRLTVPPLLLCTALALLVWADFTWFGAVAGVPNPGLCPADNVPPWWPHWIPA